ncbi:MAG: hypothetical protein HRU20_26645 [Pseudomonadales bacterium]|nr:hypothetical protein [Pseudomonadales bacterium]
MKKTLLIVFHSQSGVAEQMAFICYNAAINILVETDVVALKMRRCMDADVDDFIDASLVLFIGPENFSAIAGGMKDLLDRVFYPLERAGAQALPYSLLIAAGNDGGNCAKQMKKILLGINAKAVQQEQIIFSQKNAPLSDNDKVRCEELALSLVLGLDMGLY